GVVHVAAGDLVVAQQPGQDRQTGGVRRGPAVGPQRVARHQPGGAGTGPPGPVHHAGVPGLVEPAGALVDDDRVLVTRRVPATLDLGVAAERVADVVALVGVVEPHRHLRVRAVDDGDRDAVIRAVP